MLTFLKDLNRKFVCVLGHPIKLIGSPPGSFCKKFYCHGCKRYFNEDKVKEIL